MKSLFVSTIVMSLLFIGIVQAVPSLAEVTHSEFQAIDGSGEHIYNETDMVVLEGNPISDITNTKNISAVLFEGKFFLIEELKKMRQSKIDGM